MVEYGLPKPGVRVRFPLPAPAQEQRQLCSTFLYKKFRCKPCSLAISQKLNYGIVFLRQFAVIAILIFAFILG